MDLVLAIPFGFLIGLVVGTIGGGGAILALPVLVYVLDQGVSSATTASLIVVALGASFGAGSQARDGQVCWWVVLAFSAPAIAGAYFGTIANDGVSPTGLILAFVPVMIAAAIATFRRGRDEHPGPRECPSPRLLHSTGAGLLVGFMTGFFGVGGGFLIVPALTALLGLSMRRAVASSLAIIAVTGVAALVSHLAEGAQPDWRLTLVLCAAAAVGALAGTALGRRLSVPMLARAFATVVAVVATLLLLDVLVLGGPPTG